MVGALLLGFICGVIARVLMPGDVPQHERADVLGPVAWGWA
jgi:uncharacterized membrane protein YeaQ/YmgE (transglycosylase-associated protein family)